MGGHKKLITVKIIMMRQINRKKRWRDIDRINWEKQQNQAAKFPVLAKIPIDLQYQLKGLEKVFNAATEMTCAYLPYQWSTKSFQSYNQKNFYNFFYVHLTGCKTVKKGAYVICKDHLTKTRWVLPLNFRSQIKARIEDARNANGRMPKLYTVEEVLKEVALATISDENYKKFIYEKSSKKQYCGLGRFS